MARPVPQAFIDETISRLQVQLAQWSQRMGVASPPAIEIAALNGSNRGAAVMIVHHGDGSTSRTIRIDPSTMRMLYEGNISYEQFSAIIAHEFGHVSAAHVRTAESGAARVQEFEADRIGACLAGRDALLTGMSAVVHADADMWATDMLIDLMKDNPVIPHISLAERRAGLANLECEDVLPAMITPPPSGTATQRQR